MHVPQAWSIELDWLKRAGTCRGWRSKLLRLCVAETLYVVWCHRNEVLFRGHTVRHTIAQDIIKIVITRSALDRVLKEQIRSRMLAALLG